MSTLHADNQIRHSYQEYFKVNVRSFQEIKGEFFPVFENDPDQRKQQLHNEILEELSYQQDKIQCRFNFHNGICKVARISSNYKEQLTNYQIKKDEGHLCHIKYIQPIPDKVEDKLESGYYYLNLNKDARLQLLQGGYDFIAKDAPQHHLYFFVLSLAQYYEVFADFGFFPDCLPNLNNLIVKWDQKSRVCTLIMIPTFVMLVEFMVANNSGKEDIYKFYKVYRYTQQQTMFSWMVNNLSGLMIDKPLDEVIQTLYSMDVQNPIKTGKFDASLKMTLDSKSPIFTLTQIFTNRNKDRSQEKLSKFWSNNYSPDSVYNLLKFATDPQNCLQLLTPEHLSLMDIYPSLYDHAKPLMILTALCSNSFEPKLREIMLKLLEADEYNYNSEVMIKNKSKRMEIKAEFPVSTKWDTEWQKVEDDRFYILKIFMSFLEYVYLPEETTFLKFSRRKLDEVVWQNQVNEFQSDWMQASQQMPGNQQPLNRVAQFPFLPDNYEKHKQENIMKQSMLTFARVIGMKHTLSIKNNSIMDLVITFQLNPNHNALGLQEPPKPATSQSTQSSFERSITIEYIPSKYCLVAKLSFPDLMMQIDQADDIAVFANCLNNKDPQLNVYFNEKRQFTVSKTLCVCQPMHIVVALIQMIDELWIYFIAIHDTYQKKINPAKPMKELRYRLLADEISEYLARRQEQQAQLFQWIRSGQDPTIFY